MVLCLIGDDHDDDLLGGIASGHGHGRSLAETLAGTSRSSIQAAGGECHFAVDWTGWRRGLRSLPTSGMPTANNTSAPICAIRINKAIAMAGPVGITDETATTNTASRASRPLGKANATKETAVLAEKEPTMSARSPL